MMFRKFLAGAVVVLGLAVLLFAPARGAIALSSKSSDFASRLLTRFQDGEAGELSRLACFEEAMAELADGSSVWIQTEDPYLEQRFSDIGFPRLHLVVTPEEYGVYANWAGPLEGNILSQRTCADVNVQVVSFD
jgi:hypothetical protein